MAYTEVQERGGRRYLYRVHSVRKGGKVTKRRVFLGQESLVRGRARARKERDADLELAGLAGLLTPEDEAFLEDVRRQFQLQPAGTRQNRYEAFVAQFTFDSNAIEGNTLTLAETSDLLFEGLVPARSLREVNEALNHKAAFDQLLGYKGELTRAFVLRLHRLVVKDTLPKGLEDQAGRWRSVQVHIRGVEWMPPAPADVPKDMRHLFGWYTRNRKRIHPVLVAAYFHVAFELVHPFVDGNGRVGRLLLNFMLRKAGYPMVNISSKEKREYYAALRAGQVDGDLKPMVALLVGRYRTTRILL